MKNAFDLLETLNEQLPESAPYLAMEDGVLCVYLEYAGEYEMFGIDDEDFDKSGLEIGLDIVSQLTGE